MKHLLTLLASLTAVAAVGLASLNIHTQAVQQQVALDAQKAAAQARQVAQEAAQARNTALTMTRLESSCQDGLSAYNMLTPAQRQHVVKPDCSL